MENFLYTIGETLLLEIEEIEEITYPQGEESPATLQIKMKSGANYTLTLSSR